jgi:hypothetical protein
VAAWDDYCRAERVRLQAEFDGAWRRWSAAVTGGRHPAEVAIHDELCRRAGEMLRDHEETERAVAAWKLRRATGRK